MSAMDVVHPHPSVEQAIFRDAMAHLASGVAVVACLDGPQPRGLLVSSLTALSADPPRVLFCVAKTASSHDVLLHARDCSLNLLSEAGEQEAERFSRRDLAEERFTPEVWSLDPSAPPRLAGALVSLSGLIEQKINAGSHSIFIVRVAEAEVRKQAPLIYFDRAFRRLAIDVQT